MSKKQGVIGWDEPPKEKKSKRKKENRNQETLNVTLDVNQMLRDILSYIDSAVKERISSFDTGKTGNIVAVYDAVEANDDDGRKKEMVPYV